MSLLLTLDIFHIHIQCCYYCFKQVNVCWVKSSYNDDVLIFDFLVAYCNSLTCCDASIVELLLNGDESLDLETYTLVLNVTVDIILSSKRLDSPLI